MTHQYSYGVIPLRKFKGAWQVLLIQHGTGHWSFPKGHPEAGEEPQQTAIRELEEETGLRIKKFISENQFKETYQFMWKSVYIHKTVTYFLAEVTGEVVVQVEEIKDAKWVSVEEAAQHVTFPAARQICLQVFQELNKG
ncbi:MAG: NUDIX domain-containing protein [Parachlamydiaceae bacterium]|nr:NUDIX domain-containing protein [Parachlamydiaceae bacterium]